MTIQSKVVGSVSPDVCCPGVQTDSGDIFSEAGFLFDDFKVHYFTRLPGCEMLRWHGFRICLGILFRWGKMRTRFTVSP